MDKLSLAVVSETGGFQDNFAESHFTDCMIDLRGAVHSRPPGRRDTDIIQEFFFADPVLRDFKQPAVRVDGLKFLNVAHRLNRDVLELI